MESPSIPAKVVPPKKPDKQALEQQIESIQNEINQMQEKIHAIKEKIDKLSTDTSGSKV